MTDRVSEALVVGTVITPHQDQLWGDGSTLLWINKGLYSFWEKLQMSRAGKVYWLKAKVLRQCISMGRHFTYVQNHVFSLTIKQKQRAEPDVSGRLHRALVETSDRKHCLALMPPSSLCQAGSKTEEETCAGTT